MHLHWDNSKFFTVCSQTVTGQHWRWQVKAFRMAKVQVFSIKNCDCALQASVGVEHSQGSI